MSVLVKLSNFHKDLNLIEFTNFFGKFLNLGGRQWNSLYSVNLDENLVLSSLEVVVRLRNLNVLESLTKAGHQPMVKDNEISFEYEGRKIRGIIIYECSFEVQTVDLNDNNNIFHNVASISRADYTLKDLIDKLKRLQSGMTGRIIAISLSTKKFFIVFNGGSTLKSFLADEYFRTRAVRSRTLMIIKLRQCTEHHRGSIFSRLGPPVERKRKRSPIPFDSSWH